MSPKKHLTFIVFTLITLASLTCVGEDSVFMAIDVSRSLDTRTWRALTSRVSADVAALPTGTRLNITTFGSSVGKTPLYIGTLDPAGRERVIAVLADLEPSENWTFFQAAFSRAQLWMSENEAADGVLIFYSDGKSSLPGRELEDIPVLDAANGGPAVDAPFKVFLWRPHHTGYALVSAPGATRGGTVVATFEEVLSWRTWGEAMRARVERLQAEARQAQLEAQALSLPRLVMREFEPAEIAGAASVFTLGLLLLLVVGNGRFRTIAHGRIPNVLITPLGGTKAHGPVTKCSTDLDRPLEDPRAVTHLQIRPPGVSGEDIVVVALPAALRHELTIDSKPDGKGPHHRCVGGITGALRFSSRHDGPGLLSVTNEGSQSIQLLTPRGNEFPITPGESSEIDLEDRLSLPQDWQVYLSPPCPSSESPGLFSDAN